MGVKPVTLAIHCHYQANVLDAAHVRTDVLSNAAAGSERRLLYADQVLREIERGASLMDLPCALWWGRSEREMDVFSEIDQHELAAPRPRLSLCALLPVFEASPLCDAAESSSETV